ncbi:MAG TPA: phosphotransferase family protein [Acidimicrobiales bacterium]|nr:phosphotransferase family protein [Acidimicrobiales bacterium]
MADEQIQAERIDLAALAAWMDTQDLGAGQPIEHLTPLAGGTQNVMVKFDRGGRSFVFRRGPWSLRPRSNDQLRQEMRVLGALAGTDVPHPGLIAGCPDEGVMGDAVFYLMEPVDGFNPSVELPPLHAGSAEVRHAMGLSAADAIAALGAVDYRAVGLGDVGHPEGFLERQVPRWLSELEGYGKHEGYPGPDIPGLDDVARWLEANLPASGYQPGISHGDYHLSNLMFRWDSPDVAAIVDWEMSTIGDPLLDLGWLLATWPRPGEFGIGGNLGEGLPSPAELVARYGERSTRDLSAISWYEVMACFKLGIVLEGTHARAFAGKAPQSIGDMLHATTLGLFARATQRIKET